jgi:hypothetical protein
MLRATVSRGRGRVGKVRADGGEEKWKGGCKFGDATDLERSERVMKVRGKRSG